MSTKTGTIVAICLALAAAAAGTVIWWFHGRPPALPTLPAQRIAILPAWPRDWSWNTAFHTTPAGTVAEIQNRGGVALRSPGPPDCWIVPTHFLVIVARMADLQELNSLGVALHDGTKDLQAPVAWGAAAAHVRRQEDGSVRVSLPLISLGPVGTPIAKINLANTSPHPITVTLISVDLIPADQEAQVRFAQSGAPHPLSHEP